MIIASRSIFHLVSVDKTLNKYAQNNFMPGEKSLRSPS